LVANVVARPSGLIEVRKWLRLPSASCQSKRFINEAVGSPNLNVTASPKSHLDEAVAEPAGYDRLMQHAIAHEAA